ncbi:hypothetical protein KR018_009730, partial [Drosophila ironensis]
LPVNMSRQNGIIYSDIAIVSRGLRTLGKPVTLERLAKHMGKMLGVPSWMLKDDIQTLLNTYEPLKFFKKGADGRYSLPDELRAIMDEQEREKRLHLNVPLATVEPPNEPDAVYGYASEIDISQSLRHPYLVRYS